MSAPDRRSELEGPELTDEQSRAQVVEPAKQIVRAAGLHDFTASFRFESCNDQNEAPYRGVATVIFTFPTDADEQTYIGQVAATMTGLGWEDGPPAGKMPYGRVLHRGQMMAIMAPEPDHPRFGSLKIYGECRNLTDQRSRGGLSRQDIAGELTG
ncbi:hypothetical protein [Mycolicibacter sinensis]|uniref:Lipoprotein lppJ n=1 Tax=Mycolicibacter sinensis (strain JDM601) TaxID=875328 RepID=A0A1A2NNZ5_MYCSD|nr:hypothetical protein [Mycolicibacter sinensis]OBH16797.1 hypothetical protein A5694_00395 [Mycolicibacter sinensis]OBI25805.1 hypothetical protein A5710_08395 [Mycolicibacter sinensis]